MTRVAANPCDCPEAVALLEAAASLRTALRRIEDGDASSIHSASSRFFDTRAQLIASSLDEASKGQICLPLEELVQSVNAVSVAFHEGAHVLVAHALGLSVLSSTTNPSSHDFGSTKIAPYDPHWDSDERIWNLASATTRFAGVSGNACVSNVTHPHAHGSAAWKHDSDQARRHLELAHCDPLICESYFSLAAWCMVNAGKSGVTAVALGLLRHRELDRHAIVRFLNDSVTGSMWPTLRTIFEKAQQLSLSATGS